MDINKNNYEAFFLDYHEGNLTPVQVEDLLFFVEQHPELKREFENFENFSLEDFSSVEFENKASLKKEITFDNKEEYFIRSIEGSLNSNEISLLNNFLKKHPQFLVDLELFQKTKLSLDPSIVFEHKNSLKKSDSSAILSDFSSFLVGNTHPETTEKIDEVLIAAMEGLLSSEETTLLNEQLIKDEQLEQKFVLFQQTKLIADQSIVFEDKESLKHKNKRVIPFYYYVSIAASILLLFGLFFLFNNNKVQPEFAINAPLKNETSKLVESTPLVKYETKKIEIESFSSIKSISKRGKSKKMNLRSQDSLVASPVVVQNSPVVLNKEIIEPFINKDTAFIEPASMEQLVNNLNNVIQPDKEIRTEQPTEFLSIPELAVEKIKERLLDENAIIAQKKSGNLKKITGWDIAQVVTTGISKLTGREVELKPYYDEEGAVTAYALNAGAFQISKGR